MTSFARLERGALCDTARAVGPTAPTLCAGWSVRDLVCHLLVRERRPWATLSGVAPALARMQRRAMATYDDRPFAQLLEELREPPLLLRPEAAERLVNGVELFVHHEDIRRAQPEWAPREVPPDAIADMWRGLSLLGRIAARRSGIPLVVTDGHRRMTLMRGADPVVLTGPATELVLLLMGRRQVAGVEWSGPADRVKALRASDLSV